MLSLTRAEPDDAEAVARIVRETSAGVVDYLLGGLSLVLSPERLLTPIIMEPDNPLSHENVLLARNGDTLAGLLLSYPSAEHGTPDILRKAVSAKKLELLRGLLDMAEPNSLYINTLWVGEPYRGTGLADDLIECAWLTATDKGLAKLSLHVWVENVRAVRFYRRHGFEVCRHFEVPAHKKLEHEGGYCLMACPAQPAGDG
jgi:ribosomal protein S18 acetylase RimI-like enzyme